MGIESFKSKAVVKSSTPKYSLVIYAPISMEGSK
jgi:hypothetical protein